MTLENCCQLSWSLSYWLRYQRFCRPSFWVICNSNSSATSLLFSAKSRVHVYITFQAPTSVSTVDVLLYRLPSSLRRRYGKTIWTFSHWDFLRYCRHSLPFLLFSARCWTFLDEWAVLYAILIFHKEGRSEAARIQRIRSSVRRSETQLLKIYTQKPRSVRARKPSGFPHFPTSPWQHDHTALREKKEGMTIQRDKRFGWKHDHDCCTEDYTEAKEIIRYLWSRFSY